MIGKQGIASATVGVCACETLCKCVAVARACVRVCECHDTGVSRKPLEVRSWVREYLKQVFEDENEDCDLSTHYPVSKFNGKEDAENVMK